MKLKLFAATCAALSLTAASIATDLNAEPDQLLGHVKARDIAYPHYGIEVGAGWNSFLEQKMPAHCVDVMEVPIPKSEFSVDYDFVSDTYSLSEVTAFSGNGKYKGFGFKASASASGRNETRQNRDYLSALFNAQFNFGSTQAIPVLRPKSFLADTPSRRSAPEREAIRYGSAIRLTREAREMLEEENGLSRFIQTCGDAFVIAVHRGVRANVLVTLQASTQAAKQEFAASVSAKGFGGAIGFDAKSQKATSSESKKVSYQFFQEGGLEPFFDTSKPEALNAASLSNLFNTGRLLEGESSFMATILPYANLLDFAGDKDAARVLTVFDRLDEQRALFAFLNDLAAIISEVDRAQIIGQSQDEWLYSPIAIRALEKERDIALTRFQVHRLMRVLAASIEACYLDQVTCQPEFITVPRKERDSLSLQMKGSAQALEEARDDLNNRINVLIDAIAEGTGFAPQRLRDPVVSWIESGEPVEAFLTNNAPELTLSIDATGLGSTLGSISTLIENKSLQGVSLSAAGSKLVFEGPIDPTSGTLFDDLPERFKLTLVPDYEAQIRAKLASAVTQLRKDLQQAQQDLELLRERADGIQKAYDLYFSPLVNFEAPFNADCSTVANRRRKSALLFHPEETSGTVPSQPRNLEEVIDLLKQGAPCEKIALDDWVDTIYELAAATPLTKAQVGLDLLVNSPEWAPENTADRDTKRRATLDAHLRWKIYAERLYPFRESLCSATIAEAYCIPNHVLHGYSERLNLSIQDNWLADPIKVTPPEKPKPIQAFRDTCNAKPGTTLCQ